MFLLYIRDDLSHYPLETKEGDTPQKFLISGYPFSPPVLTWDRKSLIAPFNALMLDLKSCTIACGDQIPHSSGTFSPYGTIF